MQRYADATDIFGLAASGTNGGQAALNPIPFDAIDQVRVVLSPYDVTLSGFTGGGINAVTRSGTNQLHGSVYGFNQNQNFVGKSPNDRSKFGDFKDNIYGVRIGGPIIKNKLFFFINYEGEKRTQPVDNLPVHLLHSFAHPLDSLSNFLQDESKHPGWSYIGLFTGRIPFVWISNQYTNTGIGTISSSLNDSVIAANQVHFNPANPYQPGTGSGPGINVTDPDFKYPRTLRTNLAIDERLPHGFIASLEGIYTKTLQDIKYQDLNLAPSTADLILGNTTRPFYNNNKIDPAYSTIYALSNTTEGYSYNITASISRYTNNWSVSFAYSLGHSFTISDGTSSTAGSQYRFVYNLNGANNINLARSNYDQGSRIIGFIGKKFTYGKFSTNIGLIYSGQSGQPFSYVYFGDINGDDGSTTSKAVTSNGNDLIYLLTDASDFAEKTFFINGQSVTMSPEQQFAAFQHMKILLII